MSQTTAPIVEETSSWSSRLSLVWLIPLIALLVSLAALYQNYASQGTLITVKLEDASGITAGETKLKYREVDVGLVETVKFADGLQAVLIGIRVTPEVAPFVDAESAFWVVKPRVTVRGVSGLQTVLSGVYIEGSWDAEPGVAQTEFTGRAQPPSSQNGEAGLRIVLRAQSGNQIAEGTPVLYKGIDVGQIEAPRLSPNGDAVLFDAFVRAPYDKLITTSTRFWDASGLSFSFGASGAKLDVESIASLVSGGVSFDTLVSGGRRPEGGHLFELFDSEDEVRDNLFSGSSGRAITYLVEYADNVSGLAAGAAVEFRGIEVGEVTSLSAETIENVDDISSLKLIATISIRPKELGLSPSASEEVTTEFLSAAVDVGLRARLASVGLFGGGLKVELVEIPDAAPDKITRSETGTAIIPSVSAEITNATDTAEGVFRRINDLPIEDLVGSTIALLNSVTALTSDPALKQTPIEINGLIADARGLVAPDQVAAINTSITEILDSLKKTSTDLETITTALAADQTGAQLREAIQTASAILSDVKQASTELPSIATRVEELAAKASGLPMDQLITSTTQLVATSTRLQARKP